MNLYMNQSMKRYLDKRVRITSQLYDLLLTSIEECIESSTMSNYGTEEHIVIKDLCRKEDVLQKYPNLTDYEYTCNEIFWPGKEISFRYAACVKIVLSTITTVLQRKYKNKTFVVYIFIQTGIHGGIQTRFHLRRSDIFPIDLQLEKYKQPVLYSIIQT